MSQWASNRKSLTVSRHLRMHPIYHSYPNSIYTHQKLHRSLNSWRSNIPFPRFRLLMPAQLSNRVLVIIGLSETSSVALVDWGNHCNFSKSNPTSPVYLVGYYRHYPVSPSNRKYPLESERFRRECVINNNKIWKLALEWSRLFVIPRDNIDSCRSRYPNWI